MINDIGKLQIWNMTILKWTILNKVNSERGHFWKRRPEQMTLLTRSNLKKDNSKKEGLENNNSKNVPKQTNLNLTIKKVRIWKGTTLEREKLKRRKLLKESSEKEQFWKGEIEKVLSKREQFGKDRSEKVNSEKWQFRKRKQLNIDNSEK